MDDIERAALKRFKQSTYCPLEVECEFCQYINKCRSTMFYQTTTLNEAIRKVGEAMMQEVKGLRKFGKWLKWAYKKLKTKEDI